MSYLDVSGYATWTQDPGVYKYTHLGTAAGTTTIANAPALLSHIQVNTRAATGTIVIYDSVGTSGTVIGTISFGTQTFSDPIPFVYKITTKNALTISNTANLDLTVAALP